MSSISSAATAAANRVWNQRVAENQPAATTVQDTIILLDGLRTGLGRWIGAAGYETLLDRAVGIAREDFPWISVLFQPEIKPADLLAAIESFGTPVVALGGRRLIAVLTELLGRIVGIDMAVHLVTHIGNSGPRPATRSATEGELDE